MIKNKNKDYYDFLFYYYYNKTGQERFKVEYYDNILYNQKEFTFDYYDNLQGLYVFDKDKIILDINKKLLGGK